MIVASAVTIGPQRLEGTLERPPEASGIVIFAHGSGSSRHSPRNRQVAQRVQRQGLATLLFDLLTEEEAANRANVFDIALLANRLSTAVAWQREQPSLSALPCGLFGASTGAAAALRAAAEHPAWVRAVVSRGGRPDLAEPALSQVRAATLLIVGGADPDVLQLNRAAFARLGCTKGLEVVRGATHLFEEPGALEQVADLAAEWFGAHLPEHADAERR